MYYSQSILKRGPSGFSWDARHSQRHWIPARLNFSVTPVRVTLRLSVTRLVIWHQRVTVKHSTRRKTTGPVLLIWETPSLARTQPWRVSHFPGEHINHQPAEQNMLHVLQIAWQWLKVSNWTPPVQLYGSTGTSAAFGRIYDDKLIRYTYCMYKY